MKSVFRGALRSHLVLAVIIIRPSSRLGVGGGMGASPGITYSCRRICEHRSTRVRTHLRLSEHAHVRNVKATTRSHERRQGYHLEESKQMIPHPTGLAQSVVRLLIPSVIV